MKKVLFRLTCLAAILATTQSLGENQPSNGVDLYGDPLPEGAIARFGTTRLRHAGGIVSAMFTKDNDAIISTGGDSVLRIWDANSGRQRLAAPNPGNFPKEVQSLSNGDLLAIVDNTVMRIDGKSGKSAGVIVRHGHAITQFVVSPTHRLVASVSQGFQKPVEVRVTDLASQAELLKLTPPADTFMSITSFGPDRMAFSRDERLFIVSAADNTIQAWNLATKKMTYELTQNPWIGRSWGVSPDGKYLLATNGGSEAPQLFVWDLDSGQERYRMPIAWRRFPRLMADGKTFLMSGHDQPITEYDLATGKKLRTLTHDTIDLIAMSRDGKTLALGHGDLMGDVPSEKLRIVNYPDGKEIREISTKEFAQSDSIERKYVFSPDGFTLGLVANGKTTWGCGTGGEGIWFGPSARAQMELRSIKDGRSIVRRDYPRSLGGHRWATHVNLQFSPDSSKALVHGSWPAIRVWNTTDGREVTDNAGHVGAIRKVSVSATNSVLASHDDTDTIFVWDVASGKKMHELPTSGMAIVQMCLSPDGKRVAALETLDHWVDVVTIWSAETGTIITRIARKYRNGMQPHEYPNISSIAFVGNDYIRAVGAENRCPVSWEISIGKAREATANLPPGDKKLNELSNIVMLEELAKPTKLGNEESRGHFHTGCLSADGRLGACMTYESDKQGLQVYDLTAKKHVFNLPSDDWMSWITQVFFVPGRAEMVLVGRRDSQFLVEHWDIVAGKKMKTLDKFLGGISAVAMGRDGKYLVTAAASEQFFSAADKEKQFPTITQSEIRLWEFDSGKTIAARRCNPVRSIELSQDAKRVFAGHTDSTVMVWQMKSN